MFPNKQTTRAACVDRYGHIDFGSAHWPNQSQWMTMIAVDPHGFPNWYVDGTRHFVTSIYCNKDMAGPLANALKAVHDKGIQSLLKIYSGCFNIRMVRGNNSLFSAHSYGLAIDLNSDDNGLGSTHGGFYNHPDFVKCFTDQGFAWGGNFHGRKDPMHFSYCFEG